LDTNHTLFRQSFADLCARCLYGEIERGCTQALTYRPPHSIAGVCFTGEDDRDQLKLDITSKLTSLIAQPRRPRFTLIDVTVSSMDDNLRIVAQIKCL
jgi:hypothetical protein